MNHKNLAITEDLLTEFQRLEDRARQGIKLTPEEKERVSDSINASLSDLVGNDALNEITRELNSGRSRGCADPGFLASRSSGSGNRGKVFNSFGEQAQAVFRAAQPGQEPDKRLYQIRAATGMSEGVPSDGGSNRGPLYEQSYSINPQIQGKLSYATA